MKESEQQFNMASPNVPKKPKDKRDKKKADDKQEQKETSRNPYFEEREDSCVYLGVEVPKGKGGELVPNKEVFKDYFYTEEDYILMREIATALRLKQPYLAEGGTGIGKTSAVKRMCADLNLNYGLVSFSESTDLMDVIGHKDIVVENGEEKMKWFDGRFMEIVRRGGVLFLDEYNFQGGKIGGRVNPVIDSILNGDKKITLPENDNELVDVHPDLYLMAAQNPPGAEEGEEFTGRDVLSAEKFGRWNFHKFPIRMSKEMEEKRMLGMVGEDVKVEVPEEEFRQAGEGIPLSELKNIPGMKHWIGKYVEIREVLEAKTRDRSMGRQAQKIYFNPRLGQKMLRYISQFYRGDVNEVWKNAIEYFIVKMFKSEEDQEKVRALIEQSLYVPSETETKRKGPERDTKKNPEDLEKEKTLAEIEKIKKRIREGTVSPESLPGELAEQIKTAKEILGEDQVIGPERSEELYDITLDHKDISPIQFTKEELEAVKQRRENGELKETLIFIPPNQTIESTQNALKEKANTEEMKETGGLRFINDSVKADHFSTQKTKDRWVLSSEPLESTREKTAPVQLKTAIDELEKMHGGKLPDKYKKATEEFRNNFAKKLEEILDQSVTGKSDEEIDDLICEIVNNDEKRKKLTDWLVNEEIAQLLTPDFAEYFSVLALRCQNAETDEQKEQLRKDYEDYTRLYQRVGSVRLAGAGSLDSEGVRLGYWDPGICFGRGLFSFSRG